MSVCLSVAIFCVVISFTDGGTIPPPTSVRTPTDQTNVPPSPTSVRTPTDQTNVPPSPTSVRTPSEPTTVPTQHPGCNVNGIFYFEDDAITFIDGCQFSKCSNGIEVIDDGCSLATRTCDGEWLDVEGKCCPQCVRMTTPITTVPPGTCYVDGTYYENGQLIRDGEGTCEGSICSNGNEQSLDGCCWWDEKWFENNQFIEKLPCTQTQCVDGGVVIYDNFDCTNTPRPTPPPGSCEIDGVLYMDGDSIMSGDGNCTGSICEAGSERSLDSCCVWKKELFQHGTLIEDYPCTRTRCDNGYILIEDVLCTPPPTPPPTTPPGSCVIDGNLYMNDKAIKFDDYNCQLTKCSYGEEIWDDGCSLATQTCDGEWRDVPGQCCPQCVRMTTPITTIPPGKCFVDGTYYDNGEHILPGNSICTGSICIDGSERSRDSCCVWNKELFEDGTIIEDYPCTRTICDNGYILIADLCTPPPTPPPTTPPGSCVVDGNLYRNGETIQTDIGDKCCSNGEFVLVLDDCSFVTHTCNGVLVPVPGQCCPQCVPITTPVTTIPPGMCELNGIWYSDGERINPNENNCHGGICFNGEVIYPLDDCSIVTHTCNGVLVRVPGQCCPQCVRTTTPVTTIPPTPWGPGWCEWNGEWYPDGATIESDRCSDTLCLDGSVAIGDHACMFYTPECDGVQIHDPEQCCPICISSTTPVPTGPPGSCIVHRKFFMNGDTISVDDSGCETKMCFNGEIVTQVVDCLPTPPCEGELRQVDGKCCEYTCVPTPPPIVIRTKLQVMVKAANDFYAYIRVMIYGI